MITLAIDNGSDTTVRIVPDVIPITLQIAQMYEPTYGRTLRTLTADADAVSGDALKMVILDGSIGPVAYTIDPTLTTGLTFEVRSKDSTQETKVIADSGVIELRTGSDQTEVQLLTRETIRLYSDGTNLIDVT